MTKRKTRTKKRNVKKGFLSKIFDNKDRLLDISTKLLVFAIIVLSIGIYIVGKYENRIGTYLIVISSALIYFLLIFIAIII